MKTCRKCQRVKECSEFGIDNRALDGLRQKCKVCQRSYQRGLHRSSAWKQQRQSLSEIRAPRSNQLSNEYRKRNPEKVIAHNRVNTAIRSGTLKRPTLCEKCQLTGKTEAHHYLGYGSENWYKVQWLCRDCHVELDRTEVTRDI